MPDRLFDPEKVRAAQEAHRAFRRRSDGEKRMAYGTGEWDFFRRVSAEAWPVDFAERLARDDVSGLETALRFLEEDPFFFRSGYAKAWVLRRLKRRDLDGSARTRLAAIVLRAVDGPARREFRWYAKAAYFADRDVLVLGLLERLDREGTVAWQAFCAAHAMLGLGFPNWQQRQSDPGPQIAVMRERLRALPEAR